MSQKVIIMDVDGTLINSKRVITPKTREALMKAQQAGHRLVIASGRPTRGLMQFVKELHLDEYGGMLVSYNGSRVTNCQTGEVLFNQALTVEEGKAVLHHTKNFDVIPMIDQDEYLCVHDVYNNIIPYRGQDFNVIAYEARGCNFKLKEIDDLEAYADYPLNKVLTAASPEYLQAHYKEMMEPFKDTLCCLFTAHFYFEFTSLGIDKGKALETVLFSMGYTADDLIAFGDAQNDASMIKLAGLGIAMGNASDEVKAMAKEVTLSNDEDGIAAALEKYLF